MADRAHVVAVAAVAAAMALAAAVAGAGVFASRTPERLAEQTTTRAESVAANLAESVSLALSYGVPLDRLVGVDAFFADAAAGRDDVQRIALVGDGGPIAEFRSDGAAAPDAIAVERPVAGAAGARIVVTVASPGDWRAQVGDASGRFAVFAGLLALMAAVGALAAWFGLLVRDRAIVDAALIRSARGDFAWPEDAPTLGPLRSAAPQFLAVVRDVNQRNVAMLDLADEVRRGLSKESDLERLDHVLAMLRMRARFMGDDRAAQVGDDAAGPLARPTNGFFCATAAGLVFGGVLCAGAALGGDALSGAVIAFGLGLGGGLLKTANRRRA
ncbi:MAG: hypothetical protein AAF360_09760, partial [Pseudomonadota bacterium]